MVRDKPMIKGETWPRVKDRSKQERLAGGAPLLLLIEPSLTPTADLSSRERP